jgi:hypothetical protein
MTPPSSITDYCRQYTSRKWAVVPIPYKSKNPNRQEWQLERYTPDDIDRLFGSASSNVGVILGKPSGGLRSVSTWEQTSVRSWRTQATLKFL